MNNGNHGNPATDVWIPLGNVGVLRLPRAVFDQYLETLAPTATAQPADPNLLTSTEMEQRTSIPASWWETAARENRVEHVRLGKYVRFEFQAAIAAAREARRG